MHHSKHQAKIQIRELNLLKVQTTTNLGHCDVSTTGFAFLDCPRTQTHLATISDQTVHISVSVHVSTTGCRDEQPQMFLASSGRGRRGVSRWVKTADGDDAEEGNEWNDIRDGRTTLAKVSRSSGDEVTASVWWGHTCSVLPATSSPAELPYYIRRSVPSRYCKTALSW